LGAALPCPGGAGGCRWAGSCDWRSAGQGPQLPPAAPRGGGAGHARVQSPSRPRPQLPTQACVCEGALRTIELEAVDVHGDAVEQHEIGARVHHLLVGGGAGGKLLVQRLPAGGAARRRGALWGDAGQGATLPRPLHSLRPGACCSAVERCAASCCATPARLPFRAAPAPRAPGERGHQGGEVLGDLGQQRQRVRGGADARRGLQPHVLQLPDLGGVGAAWGWGWGGVGSGVG
jgi:hypothetical protein